MKKLVFVGILLLMSMVLFGQDFLVMDFMTEVGTIKLYDACTVYQTMFFVNFATTMYLGGLFYFGGDVKVIVYAIPQTQAFESVLFDSGFEAGLTWKMLTVFFEHRCTRPQMTIYTQSFTGSQIWKSGSDAVGIRFKGRVGGL